MKLNLENEMDMEQRVNAILDAEIMKLISDEIEKKINDRLDEIEKDEQKYINDYIEKNANSIILNMIDKITKEREVSLVESSSESHTDILEVVEDKLQEEVKEVEIKPIIEDIDEEVFTLKLDLEITEENEKLDMEITNLLLDDIKGEEISNEDVEDVLMDFMLNDDKLQEDKDEKPVEAKLKTHDSFELNIPTYNCDEVIMKTIDDKKNDLRMQIINLLNGNRDKYSFEERLKIRNEFIESLTNEKVERLYKLSKNEFNKEITDKLLN